MSARARAERPVSLRQLRLHQMQHMLRHELAGPGCRGTPGRPGARGGIAGKVPAPLGEGLHREIGDAFLDEFYLRVTGAFLPISGKVIDDDDVMMLGQGIRKVRDRPAPLRNVEGMKNLWRGRFRVF